MPVHRLVGLGRRQFLLGSSAIGRAELFGAHSNAMSDRGHFALCERQLVHGNDHAELQRQHNAVPVHRVVRMGRSQFLYGGGAIQRAELHGRYGKELPDRGHLALCERKLVHGDDHAEFQRQHDAVPVHSVWWLDRHQFLYDGGAIQWAELHGRHGKELPDRGHLALCERKLVHGNDHAEFQRQHDAVPVHSLVRRHRCKFLQQRGPGHV